MNDIQRLGAVSALKEGAQGTQGCSAAWRESLDFLGLSLLSAGAIFSVMVEIFHPDARPSALALAGSFSWVGLFITGISFPFVVVSWTESHESTGEEK